jgi:hypothetical protein
VGVSLLGLRAMIREADLFVLRDKGASSAEINDVRRLNEAIHQKQMEVSRLCDRRRAIVARVSMRQYQRKKRTK